MCCCVCPRNGTHCVFVIVHVTEHSVLLWLSTERNTMCCCDCPHNGTQCVVVIVHVTEYNVFLWLKKTEFLLVWTECFELGTQVSAVNMNWSSACLLLKLTASHLSSLLVIYVRFVFSNWETIWVFLASISVVLYLPCGSERYVTSNSLSALCNWRADCNA